MGFYSLLFIYNSLLIIQWILLWVDESTYFVITLPKLSSLKNSQRQEEAQCTIDRHPTLGTRLKGGVTN